MTWQIIALGKVERKEPIHEIERLELFDEGYICYANAQRELRLTEKGEAFLKHAYSADYASKRY